MAETHDLYRQTLVATGDCVPRVRFTDKGTLTPSFLHHASEAIKLKTNQ
jgi:hypothetical protein